MGDVSIMFLKKLVVQLDHFTRHNGVSLVFETTNHLTGDFVLQTIRFEKYEGSLHRGFEW